MAKEIGLNVFPGAGFHFAPPDKDSPFERIMNLMWIDRPLEAQPTASKPPKKEPEGHYWDIGPKPKGGSTLVPYVCDDCTRKPVCKPRSGQKNLNLNCGECNGHFSPVINF